MSLQRHPRSEKWQLPRRSRFLWTDLGALFGLLAVVGFAVYRTWF